MKKIIATVLAMVMALALCTTAFAAGQEYDVFDKDGNKGSTLLLLATPRLTRTQIPLLTIRWTMVRTLTAMRMSTMSRCPRLLMPIWF